MPNAKIFDRNERPADLDHEMFGETEEQFRAETEEAFSEYRRTGLHLTQDEVEAWMKKRARGERAPMPKPHT